MTLDPISTKRHELLSCIAQLAHHLPADPIPVPDLAKGFGNVVRDAQKCLSCGLCESVCESNAIFLSTQTNFRSLSTRETDEKIPARKLALFKTISALLESSREISEVSLPPILSFLSDVEMRKSLCVACFKCVDVCPVEALIKEPVYDLKAVLSEFLDLEDIQ